MSGEESTRCRSPDRSQSPSCGSNGRVSALRQPGERLEHVGCRQSLLVNGGHLGRVGNLFHATIYRSLVIVPAELRKRAVAIGEKIGLYRD